MLGEKEHSQFTFLALPISQRNILLGLSLTSAKTPSRSGP